MRPTASGVAAINGRIRFDGETARIERLTGRLTQGGDLAVAGTVRSIRRRDSRPT